MILNVERTIAARTKVCVSVRVYLRVSFRVYRQVKEVFMTPKHFKPDLGGREIQDIGMKPLDYWHRG